MAKVWFDFNAATNGNGASPKTPKNTLVGHTWVGGDEYYFRRGTSHSNPIVLVAGKPGQKTKYKSWYFENGDDDLSRPKCTFNLTAVISGYSGNNKDNVEIDSLRFVGNAIAVANDACVVYLGHNSAIYNCEIDTNIGCVGLAGKSNVIVANNTLSGVSHSNANGNNLIFATDSRDVDNIRIENNTLTFKGGGNENSHGIRAGADLQQYSMTNLRIIGNTILPVTGATDTTNRNANQKSHGIRLQRCPNAEIAHNNVRGMLAGLFMTGGGTKWGAWVHHNTFSNNWNFGIHAVTDIMDCMIEFNDCSYNGTHIQTADLPAYGRGIEFSGAAGQSRCGFSIVRYNTCNYNYNYGGPLDNGSEGVGIGFDDGTVGCLAYGNTMMGNEGNGLQYYGGPLGAGWTDTSNHCVANLFINNCTASFHNRRTGGTNKTAFSAHVGMAATIGGQSIVANNVMVGGDCGVSQSSNCTNVVVANNVFQDILGAAIAFGHAAGYGCFNNIFFNAASTIKKYATTALDANNSPTYPTLAYDGTADLTTNPLLNTSYRPMSNSPCNGAGYSTAAIKFLDYDAREFKDTPSIGMYENWAPSNFPAIRL